MTSGEHEHDTTDPLRLDRCPDCGYLLTGLPKQGICPECGFAYGTDMIVLYGWGRGQRANVANARGWRLVVFGLLACMWALQLLLPYIVMPTFFRSWRSLCIIGSLAVLTWSMILRWRRNRRDSPAPVQLRLCPQGFAQRDGVGPVKLRQWEKNTRISLHRSGERSCRIAEKLSFWSLPHRAVDMEFECDSQAAERIVSRINTWRGDVLLERTFRSNSVRHD